MGKNNIKKKPAQDKAKPKKKVIGDGYENFLSRVGLQQRNQLSGATYLLNLLTRNRIELENMYRGSWIVGKIIDSYADDMTRAGIQITSTDAAEDVKKLQVAISRLKIWGSLADLVRWGRLYGGAIAVLQIEGQNMATPLNLKTIGPGQFKGLAVYDRWQLNPSFISVIQSGPDIGLPVYYQIVSSTDNIASFGPDGKVTKEHNPTDTMLGGVVVHHSRVIRMIGIPLPYYQAITEMMWGESVIERLYDRLTSFDNTTLAAANLVNRAYLRTVGIADLREILAAGGKAQENLVQMFDLMATLQSNEGITLLDKNDEYKSESYSFTGLDKVLIQFGQQISGSSDVPMVRLFGQSPAGLNSTGESDLRMYYDGINSKQEANLREGIEKILGCMFPSLFGKPIPEDLTFIFNGLWQLSATDKATVGKLSSETVVGVYDSGLIQRSTALKELKQNSTETGLFSNITDEEINQAETEEAEAPLPGVENQGSEGAGQARGTPRGFTPIATATEVKAPQPDPVKDKGFFKRWKKK